jgi:lipopolysaccharide transport system permease protein
MSDPAERAPPRTVVYDARSQLRAPGQMLRAMRRDLVASRHLAWLLFTRDLRVRYRDTALGGLWVVLPIVAAALPFVFLQRQRILIVDTGGVAYLPFVLAGTLLWQLFSDALQAPLRSIAASQALLSRVSFPREALLLAAVGQVLFDFLLRFVAFALLLLAFDLGPSAGWLWVPLGAAALVVLGLTLGLLLTPVYILGDLQRGLSMALGLWFLLTPVVYPAPAHGVLAEVTRWNPLTPLVVSTRAWLLGTRTAASLDVAAVLGASCVLLLLGWISYRVALPHLIARLGA